MPKKSKAVILICGAASIIVTIISYLLTFDNIFTIPMRWTSLIFLILAEIIGAVKALNIKKSIFGLASIIVSLFHFGIVLAISIIFVNTFPFLIRKYVLLNLPLLSIMLAIDVIVIYFGKYIRSKNKVLSENQAIAGSLYTTAMGLAIEYKESAYTKNLNEICELLKYSDNSALSGDDESVPQKISDIKKTAKLHSLKIKSTKRGSY